MKKLIVSFIMSLLIVWTWLYAYSSDQKDAANNLANMLIIKDKSSNPSEYNLDQNVLRQEIAIVAKRVAGVNTKDTCDNIFKDLSATNPNDWACVNIEALVDADLISRNEYFRPEDNISKSEALIMLIKAIWFTDFQINNVSNWQQEVVNYAADKWVVEKFYDYNTLATRGWVFEIADTTIKIEEEEKWIKREVYSDEAM